MVKVLIAAATISIMLSPAMASESMPAFGSAGVGIYAPAGELKQAAADTQKTYSNVFTLATEEGAPDLADTLLVGCSLEGCVNAPGATAWSGHGVYSVTASNDADNGSDGASVAFEVGWRSNTTVN